MGYNHGLVKDMFGWNRMLDPIFIGIPNIG